MLRAVPTVRSPWKSISPVVFVRVTVAAFTLPVKLVPPELVTVTVPMSVPMAPAPTVEVVLKVTLEGVPPATPLIVPVLIRFESPLPMTSVALSAMVMLPKSS